ncbi:hypothetical protein QBC43DRAFT_365532 [Cladorrhinum sp. PSN259]|nr:hypothetical protein QBC43DRAFT_365532 [Cladorrhinum sp. PSN259]
MHPSSILLLAAATAATANLNHALVPAHLAAKRAIDARQTEFDDSDLPAPTEVSACLSTLTAVLKDVPTPPAAIVSFAVTQTETDPCSVSIPNSLTSAYSSYSSALQSWFSTKSDSLTNALKVCPGYEDLVSSYEAPTCATAGPSKGGSGGGKGGSDDTTTTVTTAASVPANTTKAGGAGATTTPAASSGSGSSGSGQQQQGGSNNNNSNNNTPAQGAASSLNGLTAATVLMAGVLGVAAVL